MPTFGRPSSERESKSGGGGGRFLNYFKEPRTLVWILEDRDPENWTSYFQHFDPAVNRGFPCAIEEGGQDCVGCSFPIEDPTDENDRGIRTQKKSEQWVFACLTEDGYINLFQCGYGLWNDLRTDFNELGTLVKYQYAIRKTKEGGRKTTYTPSRLDNTARPELKYPIPGIEKVQEILGRQYEEAIERYGYSPDERPEPVEPTEAERPGDTASEALAAAKTAAANKGQAPADEAQSGGWVDDKFDARGADVTPEQLKAWLDAKGVEYPSRAPKADLVKLVEKVQIPF